MADDISPSEARALANVVAGMERGGYGLRPKRLLDLIGTAVPEYGQLVARRGSLLLEGLVTFAIDMATDQVVALLAHTASSADARFRAEATSERQRAGINVALAVLLFLFYRQSRIGAPATPFSEITRQFEQTMGGLEVRIRQHLEWLIGLGFVREIDGAESLYAITSTGRAAFPLELLVRLVSASQGAPVPAETVARYFGLGAPVPPYSAEIQLSHRDRVALARIMAASQTGDGLPVEHVLALLGSREVEAVATLVDRANQACRGILRFVVDASGRVVVGFADLPTRDTRTVTREGDVGAAILMYLFYAQGAMGQVDLAEEGVMEVLQGLGSDHQLQIHAGRLEGRGLIRRAQTSTGRRITLTAAGWAAFPSWLYDRLPTGSGPSLPALAEAEAYFRRYLTLHAGGEAAKVAAAQQMTFFGEDD